MPVPTDQDHEGRQVATRGQHLILDFWGVRHEILDDAEELERTLRAAARAARTRIIGTIFHRFSPQGVTGVVAISESHISIHTWPEDGYAAIDVYTCGAGLPDAALRVLVGALDPVLYTSFDLARGVRAGLAARNRTHPTIEVRATRTELRIDRP